ncbi:MAG: hypothetical protein ACXWSD_00885 [Bdellovibrionota bacterium]
MIEVMIAGGLIAFIAVALLPAVFSVVDTSKSQGFRSQCSGVVRAKLQEYLNGVIDSNGVTAGATAAPSGFEYTKSRYQNQNGGGAGVPNYCSLSPNVASPGWRESVYGNAILAASAVECVPGSTGCALGSGGVYVKEATSGVAVMPGFQLWVMLRQYNPRVLQTNGTVSATGQPLRACPLTSYQFFGVGDAIEVTVTGMVRTDTGGRNGVPVGKLYDLNHIAGNSSSGNAPNPLLTCSATEVVYPPRVPFRYYLASDGKIRNYQASMAAATGGAASGSAVQAMESHFRNVWVQQSGGTPTDTDLDVVVANIRSFAVSPDNKWVYVLRPGELARYGPCYDDGTVVGGSAVGGAISLTSSGLNSTTFNGIPDCPPKPSTVATIALPTLDGLTWKVDPNVENIAVDFGTDSTLTTNHKIYAITNGQTGDTGANSSILVTNNSGNALPAGSNPVVWATVAATGSFQLPLNHPRIRGMFIQQSFPSTAGNPTLMFFDNTCYTANGIAANTSTYCASIFNSADSNMQQDLRELPLQIEGISY